MEDLNLNLSYVRDFAMATFGIGRFMSLIDTQNNYFIPTNGIIYNIKRILFNSLNRLLKKRLLSRHVL